MIICNKGDIVVVPFPFVDSPKAKPRPVLAISKYAFNEKQQHTIFMMITTGKMMKWPSDIQLTDLENTGLKEASVLRFKLFTLDNRIVTKSIGRLSQKDLITLRKKLANIF